MFVTGTHNDMIKPVFLGVLQDGPRNFAFPQHDCFNHACSCFLGQGSRLIEDPHLLIIFPRLAYGCTEATMHDVYRADREAGAKLGGEISSPSSIAWAE